MESLKIIVCIKRAVAIGAMSLEVAKQIIESIIIISRA